MTFQEYLSEFARLKLQLTDTNYEEIMYKIDDLIRTFYNET